MCTCYSFQRAIGTCSHPVQAESDKYLLIVSVSTWLSWLNTARLQTGCAAGLFWRAVHLFERETKAQSELIAPAAATYLHRTALTQPSSREPWRHLICYRHLSDSPPVSLTYLIVCWTSNFSIFSQWKLQAHPPQPLFLFCLSSWLQAVKGKWVNATRWSSVEATGLCKI